MLPLPIYVTQDEEDKSTMVDIAATTSIASTNTSTPSRSLSSKKRVQKNLFGKVVPITSKTKVSSYKRKNGTAVTGHTRKIVSKTPKSKSKSLPSQTTISFKSLSAEEGSCKASINLAFSLQVDEMKELIRSVGKKPY